MTQHGHRGPVQQAQVGDLSICYQTYGDPDRPPLLLVSGLGCQMIEWDEDLCVQLAARGYRVIRYDNRGVGMSTKLDTLGEPDLSSLPPINGLFQPEKTLAPPYTLRDMAADGIGLLDVLGIDRAHVVGMSMGGLIVQHMAIHWPQRVLTAIPVMSSSGDPSLPPIAPEVLPLMVSDPPDLEAFVAHYVAWEQAISGPRYPRSPAYLERMARAIFPRGRHGPAKRASRRRCGSAQSGRKPCRA